jgi:hypothetical protein
MPALAHTLFRLQRFGVPAPRLLAVGYAKSGAFVATQAPATILWAKAFAKASAAQRCRMLRQAGWIVRQIHEAGHHLPPGAAWENRLAIAADSGDVMLVNAGELPRTHASWQELAPIELARPRVRLSRTEQLRFLHGYLQRKRRNAKTANHVAMEEYATEWRAAA